MDHRPYEDWLLDDERLTPEKERDLRSHLRTCADCAALARANQALRAAPMSVPAAGFAVRFQARLAAERKVQRRRSFFGWTLLLLVGMAALFFLVRPYLAYLSWSPAQLAATWLSNLVYIGLTARAMSLIGNTLLDVFVSFVPSYVWAASFALFGGIGSLWVLSFRKLGRFSLPGEPVKTAAYRLKE
jgi:hypothetical protein